jgi:hypothetical protein
LKPSNLSDEKKIKATFKILPRVIK